ncbi:DUF6090 family protein [Tamlana flava]|uniref:DUF6090 family protein n=1 Tax=Tamlana flava TaxID=3158572 RepID=UPI00351AF30E
MIKFFRKIRQKLISENKFSKYLVYAIGEIVLVVIGILIALGINNWNSDRINTIREKDYLIGIKNDLEKQIPVFNSLVKRCDSILIVGNNILNDYKSIQDFSLINDLNKKLSLFFYAENFPEISTTFDELKSTGQINLIKNKFVRTKIISYYQNAKESQVGMRFILSDIVYSHIYPTLKSSTIITQENLSLNNNTNDLPSKLQSVLKMKLTDSDNELELFNAINLRIKAAIVNQSVLLNAKDEAMKLIDALEKELK